MRTSWSFCCWIALVPVLSVAAAAADVVAQDIPAHAGPFVLTDSSRYEQAELGIMYTYRNEPERVGGSAYVYPVYEARRALPVEQQLAQEAETFVASLRVGVDRGWYDDVQLVVNEARTFETAEGPRPGHLVAAVLRRDGGALVSFMHLVVLGDQYVKTRLTMPAEQWRTSMAPNFGPDLFKQLAAPVPDPQ